MSDTGIANSLSGESTEQWNWFGTIFATMVPLMLLWNPLRGVINEYRLFRRCQQYPHIIVCKAKSSGTSSVWIKNWVLLMAGLLFNALCCFFGIMWDIFVAIFTSLISKNKGGNSEASKTEPNIITEERERPKMAYSRVTIHSEKGTSPTPLPETKRDRYPGERIQSFSKNEEFFKGREQTDEVFEPSPAKTKRFDNQHIRNIAPVQQQRPLYTNHGRVRPLRHRIPSPMAMSLVRSVHIDSSSLSEKMKKRRLQGGNNAENQLISHEQDGGASRKKRKLNGGRMPLHGYMPRRPAVVGVWKTAKVLDKREREEREERLLRGMSRKRSKPTNETTKALSESKAATTTSSIAATSTASTNTVGGFNLTQTTAQTAAAESKPNGNDTAPAPVPAPAPAFQFGTSKSDATELSKPKENGATDTKQAGPSFSFGNAPTSTTNTATSTSTRKIEDKSSASLSTPAPTFQFGAPSGNVDVADTSKSQEATKPPVFGNTPVTQNFGAAPAPASSAPTFGTVPAPSASTFGAATAPAPSAPTFGAAPAQSAPTFGSTPAPSQSAPTFGTAPVPAPSAPTFGAAPVPAPSAPTFGAAPVPAPSAPTFGAAPVPAPSAPTFGATPAPSFGATTAPPTPVPPTFGAVGTQATPTPGSSGFGTGTTVAPSFGATAPAPATFGAAPTFGAAAAPTFGATSSATAASATGGFGAPPASSGFGAATPSAPSFGAPNQSSFGIQATKSANTQSFSFGNTKENTNPGNLNSSFQQGPPQATGFMKSAPANGSPLGMNGGFSAGVSNATAMPAFGDGAGGFNAGTNSASARRMARKSRTRRR